MPQLTRGRAARIPLNSFFSSTCLGWSTAPPSLSTRRWAAWSGLRSRSTSSPMGRAASPSPRTPSKAPPSYGRQSEASLEPERHRGREGISLLHPKLRPRSGLLLHI